MSLIRAIIFSKILKSNKKSNDISFLRESFLFIISLYYILYYFFNLSEYSKLHLESELKNSQFMKKFIFML